MTTEEGSVVDNVAEHRFELVQDGHLAELVYERRPHALVLIHTGVPTELRGGGVGGRLVDAALADARRTGLKLIVLCPFARSYLTRHPPPDGERHDRSDDRFDITFGVTGAPSANS